MLVPASAGSAGTSRCRSSRLIGYGGGRALPSDHALLPAAGFAAFVMDTRGQGGRWSIGATGDAAPGAEYATEMTRGIADPESYYFTRLYADAALAVETAAGPGRRR